MSRETDFSARRLPRVRAPRAKVRECLSPEWLGLVICHTDPGRIVYSQEIGELGMPSVALPAMNLCPPNSLQELDLFYRSGH